MHAIRVFISYSREDKALVEKIASILEKNGLLPILDKDISCGDDFHEKIKVLIIHAHVFMPIITRSSSQRGWVHQEIGYAMAMNIPVLPISISAINGQMIQQIQAVVLDNELTDANNKLTKNTIESLIGRFSNSAFALHYCAEQQEERAMKFKEYADEIIACGFYGSVRQKGWLSSFRIPDRLHTSAAWDERYHGKAQINDYHCKCMREERIALEKHARKKGCRLILFPDLVFDEYDDIAIKARFTELIAFLKTMPDDKACVAINHSKELDESITFVGDWFAAEAIKPKVSQHYRQTIFTRHAPSMIEKIELFDNELDYLLKNEGWTKKNSKLKAIEYLEALL